MSEVQRPYHVLSFVHKEHTLSVVYGCGCGGLSDTNSIPGFCPEHGSVYIALNVNRFDTEGIKDMGELFRATTLH